MATNKELREAFGTMIECRNALFEASEKELKARETLKDQEAFILVTVDAKELGPNEAARQAKIHQVTAPERANLALAERAKQEAQLALDLASMAVDCLKWQIRNDTAAIGGDLK